MTTSNCPPHQALSNHVQNFAKTIATLDVPDSNDVNKAVRSVRTEDEAQAI